MAVGNLEPKLSSTSISKRSIVWLLSALYRDTKHCTYMYTSDSKHPLLYDRRYMHNDDVFRIAIEKQPTMDRFKVHRASFRSRFPTGHADA